MGTYVCMWVALWLVFLFLKQHGMKQLPDIESNTRHFKQNILTQHVDVIDFQIEESP